MLAPVRISLKARWSLNPGHGIARFCYGLCALSRVSLHGPGILETDRLYPSRAFDTTIWAKNSVQYMALVHPLAYEMRLLN